MKSSQHKQEFEDLYKKIPIIADEIEFPLTEIDCFEWNRGPWGNTYFSYFYKRFTCHILDRLEIKNNDRVLVLGCGAGLDEKNIKVLYPEVTICSIDISEEMIKKALINRSPSRFSISLAEALPFKSSSFDRVLSREVIEHVMDPGKMLAEIGRVLKAGGRAVVTTENGESLAPVNFYFNHIRTWIARRIGVNLPETKFKDEAPSILQLSEYANDANLDLSEYFLDGALYRSLLHLRRFVRFDVVTAAHFFSALENKPSLSMRFCDQIKYVLKKPADLSSDISDQDCVKNTQAVKTQSKDAHGHQVTGPSTRTRSFLFKIIDRTGLGIYTLAYILAAFSCSLFVKGNKHIASRQIPPDSPFQKFLKG